MLRQIPFFGKCMNCDGDERQYQLTYNFQLDLDGNGVRMKVPPVKNPFAIDNVNNKDCSTRASIQVVMLDPVI